MATPEKQAAAASWPSRCYVSCTPAFNESVCGPDTFRCGVLRHCGRPLARFAMVVWMFLAACGQAVPPGVSTLPLTVRSSAGVAHHVGPPLLAATKLDDLKAQISGIDGMANFDTNCQLRDDPCWIRTAPDDSLFLAVDFGSCYSFTHPGANLNKDGVSILLALRDFCDRNGELKQSSRGYGAMPQPTYTLASIPLHQLPRRLISISLTLDTGDPARVLGVPSPRVIVDLRPTVVAVSAADRLAQVRRAATDVERDIQGRLKLGESPTSYVELSVRTWEPDDPSCSHEQLTPGVPGYLLVIGTTRGTLASYESIGGRTLFCGFGTPPN